MIGLSYLDFSKSKAALRVVEFKMCAVSLFLCFCLTMTCKHDHCCPFAPSSGLTIGDLPEGTHEDIRNS